MEASGHPLSRIVALHAVVLVTALSWAACRSPVAPDVPGTPSRQISLVIGQEIGIRLGTLGSGEYATPPSMSGTAVRFLDVSVCCNTPGGVVQVFHFVAVASGQSIVAFHNTDPSRPVVEDTMVVR